MPKSSSGWSYSSPSGREVPGTSKLAGREVMSAIASALERGTNRFHELKPYANIEEIREAQFTGGVLGTYSSTREITVKSGLSPEQNAWVGAHEVAHGFLTSYSWATSKDTPAGYNTPQRAVDLAVRQYNRRHGTNLNAGDFSRLITPYAGTRATEAVSEAFADWSTRGRGSTEASRLILSNLRRRGRR